MLSLGPSWPICSITCDKCLKNRLYFYINFYFLWIFLAWHNNHLIIHITICFSFYSIFHLIGLAEEGLFRKSGHASRQRQLQDSVATVSHMEALEHELENGVYTAHDCASIIKIFLRELPEPLLTNKHYVAYCQIPG